MKTENNFKIYLKVEINFQDNWQKQNKMINDIKKKFIKLRLEKDGRNLRILMIKETIIP